jgi:signal transduction histidine kinase
LAKTAQDRDDHARVRAAESRLEFAVAGSFTLLLAGTLAYVHSLFAPITPPDRLWLWTGMTGFTIACMMLLPLTVLLRRPDDAEINRLWSPAGKVVAVMYNLVVAASVWMLLPYASEPLRLLMVIFYAAAISGQVISTAESIENIVFGVVSVFGSAALFFLGTPGPYSGGLAIFLVAFGALMLGVAVTLKYAVRSAIKARLTAEAVSADLATALTVANDARDAKTRFIAAASHDLRQPLQAAVLFFEQLRRSEHGPVRDKAEAGVALAFEEADALLDRMLEHLRLDAGAVEARRAPSPAGEILQRVAQESAAFAASEGIAIAVAPTRLWADTDPAMTGRVLRNFVHNAIRHARCSRILLGARRRGDKVRLYVVDDGQGVAEADRAGLFEAYVQGSGADRENRGGLGLGLASARRMAGLMGGEVGLDAGRRRGAAFWIDLPACRPGAAAASPQQAAAASATGRVLIVDDDEAARQALAGLFADRGWRVVAADGVAEARAFARDNPFDLIISDWRLGGGDTGADAVAAARQVTPGLPAMLITGDGSPESHRAIQATGLPVLYKPTPPDRILGLAAELL